MSFDENRHYREVDIRGDAGHRETVQLQKTGIGADTHVYLKGQDLGSIEEHDGEILVYLPGRQHPITGKPLVSFRPTEQDALNLLLDVYEHDHPRGDISPHEDDCNIGEHTRREVLKGMATPTLNPRPGGPKTYLLTESLGILTGLSPSEQDFIDKLPPGTNVGLVREMFAFHPDRVDTDPGPEPEPAGVSDELVSFVEFLSREAPVHTARMNEHVSRWWDHPQLVTMFDSLMQRWTSKDIPDGPALNEAFGVAQALLPVHLGGITPDELGAAIEAHFGGGPEPDADTTTDPSTTD